MDILLVEDADDQRFVIATALINQGYNVIEAKNATEALKILTTNKHIRIMLTDWMMPELNGLELCDHIRKNIPDRYIYIIILSGKSDQQAIVEGIGKGADDFLYKPINFTELKARLHAGTRIIKLKQKLENKIRTIETDLKAAADTQIQMISKPNKLVNLNITWLFRPSMYLGGDMLGYHFLTDTLICFYQLDVAGHGIPSSLFSVKLNNVLSGFQSNTDILMNKNIAENSYTPKEPHEVLKTLNSRFQATTIDMLYFTIIYGIFDTNTGNVQLSHAGHPYPLWLSAAKNEINVIKGDGIPIGLIPNSSYTTTNFTLQPNDKLFIYSDGLTECNNVKNDNELFGSDRLIELLKTTNKITIEDIKNKIENKIINWHGDYSFNDDVSFLLLEWKP